MRLILSITSGRRFLCAAICLLVPLHAAPSVAFEPSALLLEQAARATVRGWVVDPTGAAIPGVPVIATAERPGTPVATVTDQRGEFELALVPGVHTLQVVMAGFAEVVQRIELSPASESRLTFTLQIAGLQEAVSVSATAYTPSVSSATKTNTPLRDLPQAVSVVSRALLGEQRMASMADVVRYMPGVGIAQGEGNRDTPVLRGNSSTSDFFVDGVRDDVQYFRDVYNLERVEALKGPNAMIFGRGGIGGVINRVTRQAEWGSSREASLQFGSWSNKRFTADVGRALGDTVAVRATTMYENSDSYRNGVGVERYGVNPTVAFRLTPRTTLRASYEHFHDARVADRGVSSLNGRPVSTGRGTFFGSPAQSPTQTTVNLLSSVLEHRLGTRVAVRSRISYGDYDKFYQNVFPGVVNGAASTVAISAYNDATVRQNLFSQTDVIATAQTGRLRHTVLLGAEFGRQDNANRRLTGFFPGMGANVASVSVPLTAPTMSLPLEFRASGTNANNQGVTTIAGVYAQDQVALTSRLEAIVGLRFDSFQATVTDNRTGNGFRSDDGLLSPRLGLVYKPVLPLSLYTSYSLTYLPRAGEQLSSLSVTNQALDPEHFRNYEVGAKWDVVPALSLTAALYRIDRGNVAVPDPNNPAVSTLVDAQRNKGLELGVDGRITRAWSVVGGYAWQAGQITRSISATAAAGASLPQLPSHSVSLWNKYEFTSRVAGALGVVHQGQVFTSTDNRVTLPRWTRADAAVFYALTQNLRAQVNVENLLDAQYFPNAHNNTNITPGSPRAVRFALTTTF